MLTVGAKCDSSSNMMNVVVDDDDDEAILWSTRMITLHCENIFFLKFFLQKKKTPNSQNSALEKIYKF